MGEEAADIEKKMFCISKSQANGGSHLVYPYQGIIANAHILSYDIYLGALFGRQLFILTFFDFLQKLYIADTLRMLKGLVTRHDGRVTPFSACCTMSPVLYVGQVDLLGRWRCRSWSGGAWTCTSVGEGGWLCRAILAEGEGRWWSALWGTSSSAPSSPCWWSARLRLWSRRIACRSTYLNVKDVDIVCHIKEYDIKLMTIPGRRSNQLGANDRKTRREKRSCWSGN